ncbi:hypothetical protein GCM10007157_35350 [Vreelandella hamiltonii]|uniref:ATP-grasp domain-containing protein n=2 Tax=Vreelandella hamiltonii TaxID=502829 RepID=A0A8H9I6E8_9GAMM|nr:hypothetical protein GCM10007157_35350 [Halomonas hamiltonii]
MVLNNLVKSFFRAKIEGSVVKEENDFHLYRKRFNKNFVVFCGLDFNSSKVLNKKFPGINTLTFLSPNQVAASEINLTAVLPFSKSIVYFFDSKLENQIPDFCFDSGVVLVHEGKLVLKKKGSSTVELLFQSESLVTAFFYIASVVALNFGRVISGVINERDIIKNYEKREYFRKPRKHELISISGKKVETAEFCKKNKIKIPRIILTKLDNVVLQDNDVFENSSFVIKDNSGCSSQGVHVVQKEKGHYIDLMSKEDVKLSKLDIQAILDKYQSCIVEEKIGSDGTIPYDLKVYCYNGKPKLILLIDRNYKRKEGKVYVKAYDLKSNSFIDGFMLNNQERFFEPPEDIEDLYRKYLSNDLVERVRFFCSEVLSSVEYYEFVSIDLFEQNNTLYLGEFTKTPGAFLYHLNPSNFIEWIFERS